jgi:ABC-type dipeptide/oligopeptide/nickel transport system permease component
MALSTITAVAVLVSTLVADLAYAAVDPRVRHE